MHGYTPDKDKYLTRLRRIEGQVRGLEKMVEDDKYCIDILTQVSAATRALQSVALGLLEDHLGHCVHAVSGELKELDGVSDVAVDLHPGGESAVTVTSQAPLTAGAVVAALD